MNVRKHRHLRVFGLTVAALGVLLWARLLLVSSPPRIATAQPPLWQPDPRFGEDERPPAPPPPPAPSDAAAVPQQP